MATHGLIGMNSKVLPHIWESSQQIPVRIGHVIEINPFLDLSDEASNLCF
jgi:hypothetical protein